MNKAAKWITIVLAILGMTVSAFAYITTRFEGLEKKYARVEVMDVMCKQLDRIERKVDRLYERGSE